MGLFTRSIGFFRNKKTFTADEFVFSYLKNAGSAEMAVNGTTPKVFEYVVPAGKNVWIQRLNIFGTNTNIDPDNFFGISALSNGLKIEVVDSSDVLIKDFTDGLPIKSLIDLSALAGSDAGSSIDRLGSADSGATVRWTISKAGEPLFIREGYKFRVTVRDNISGITKLRMMLQGTIVSKW